MFSRRDVGGWGGEMIHGGEVVEGEVDGGETR